MGPVQFPSLFFPIPISQHLGTNTILSSHLSFFPKGTRQFPEHVGGNAVADEWD